MRHFFMNKSELIDRIAARADLTKSDASKALEALIDTITDTLTHRESVTLVGFGTWDTSDRPARQVRNPKTGALFNCLKPRFPDFVQAKNSKQPWQTKKRCRL